jgi:hypothetical protein
MGAKKTAQAVEVVTAKQAAEIIGCARSYISTLQLKGVLTPHPTPTPKLYYHIDDVNKAKSMLLKNKRNNNSNYHTNGKSV